MAKFVSDKMPYVMLRGRCCDVIVLTVNVPKVDKLGDMKDRYYEEPENVFDKFPFLSDSARPFMALLFSPAIIFHGR
jgi:hypothetical protein